MKLIKWTMVITGAGALLLVSNLEHRAVGSWADMALVGIGLFWASLGPYFKWQEREEKRRQNRKRSRAIERGLNEESKREYLRKTMAA